jgi:hypothetical protein
MKNSKQAWSIVRQAGIPPFLFRLTDMAGHGHGMGIVLVSATQLTIGFDKISLDITITILGS